MSMKAYSLNDSLVFYNKQTNLGIDKTINNFFLKSKKIITNNKFTKGRMIIKSLSIE